MSAELAQPMSFALKHRKWFTCPLVLLVASPIQSLPLFGTQSARSQRCIWPRPSVPPWPRKQTATLQSDTSSGRISIAPLPPRSQHAYGVVQAVVVGRVELEDVGQGENEHACTRGFTR